MLNVFPMSLALIVLCVLHCVSAAVRADEARCSNTGELPNSSPIKITPGKGNEPAFIWMWGQPLEAIVQEFANYNPGLHFRIEGELLRRRCYKAGFFANGVDQFLNFLRQTDQVYAAYDEEGVIALTAREPLCSNGNLPPNEEPLEMVAFGPSEPVIFFDRKRLWDVLDEFSRYNRPLRPLPLVFRVEGKALHYLCLSGSLNLTDVPALLRLLRHAGAVTSEDRDGVIVLREGRIETSASAAVDAPAR